MNRLGSVEIPHYIHYARLRYQQISEKLNPTLKMDALQYRFSYWAMCMALTK